MRVDKMVVACLVGLSLLAPGSAFAQQDVKGSKDHPMLSRYEGAVIIGYRTVEFDEYVLALGKSVLDAKRNCCVLQKVQKLEGKITRILYKAPKGQTTLAVLRNYEKALRGGRFETLFRCDKEACGFSLGRVLKPDLYEFTLSGSYRDERYLAARLARPEGDIYLALFVFEHTGPHTKLSGNVLVQQDVIEIEALKEGRVTVNAEAMARDISERGHVAVYGIHFDTDKAELKPESEPVLAEIAKLLKANAGLKLLVVGHTDNQGTLDYNLDLSQRRALAVVDALASRHGVARERLTPRGLGFLAPVASNRTDEGRAKNRRVELVEH